MITKTDRAVIMASHVAYEKYAACEQRIGRNEASKIFLETYKQKFAELINLDGKNQQLS